jgi:hypothetical protein
MAVTVASTDVPNYVLQGEITDLTTQISAAQTAGNYPLAGVLTQLQIQKQIQLVASLMSQGSISASGILAGTGQTYSAPTASAGGAN